MVDLVKIRKKARKDSSSGSSVPREEPAAPEQSSPPEQLQPAEQTPPPEEPRNSSDKLERFKQTAGTHRENFIEEEVETSANDEIELLTFAIAGEQYAVAIEHIVEIVRPRAITRVPNAEETIVGIISLRGTIVTLIDVRKKLRHGAATRGDDTRVIVVERGGETLGFEVDRVLRVVKTVSGSIEPHPVVHASEQSESIRGVFRHSGALTILLDLDKLLA